MKKVLYLMRHGQTLFNVRRKIQGFCDSPLTDIGISQAKVAKKYFEKNNINFDYCYSSTSERACDTLEIVTDMPYKRLKGLKEWNFGVFEGESEDLNPNPPYGDFFVQYGGESQKEVAERFRETLLQIMNNNGKNYFIVSHGGAIFSFINLINNSNIQIKNCSILKIEYYDNIFKLVDIINHDFNVMN